MKLFHSPLSRQGAVFIGMIFLFFSAGIGIILLLHGKWYVVRPASPLTPKVKQELVSLGIQALQSLDVPVAALLFYGDSLIGRGYNTVVRDGNAGGHAEINAISSAIRKFGLRNFMQLNRDSLWLISSYEPCPMCVGAFVEYNIPKVFFLKSKPLPFLLRQDFQELKYFWSRQSMKNAALQDSLFQLHPKYPERN